MLAIITKASDDNWYCFKDVKTIDDVLAIHSKVVIGKNIYRYDVAEIIKYWDGFKVEDAPKLQKAKIHITIYDSYIE